MVQINLVRWTHIHTPSWHCDNYVSLTANKHDKNMLKKKGKKKKEKKNAYNKHLLLFQH